VRDQAVHDDVTGEDALAMLGVQSYQIVLSDMGMGAGMNGWELAEVVARVGPQRPDRISSARYDEQRCWVSWVLREPE
jgi:CheY-like chemotaxis protein